MTTFDQAILRRPPPTPQPPVMSGSVTRSDASGVWVTATGGDENHPSGPCLGGWGYALVPADATVTLQRTPLARGTRVAYVPTPDGPWILNWE